MALTTLVLLLVERTCSTQDKKDAVLNDFKEIIEDMTNQLSEDTIPRPSNVVVEWKEATQFASGLSSFAAYLGKRLVDGNSADLLGPVNDD